MGMRGAANTRKRCSCAVARKVLMVDEGHVGQKGVLDFRIVGMGD